MEIARFYVGVPDQAIKYVATVRYVFALEFRHMVMNGIIAGARPGARLRIKKASATMISITD